ncbi:protein containing DUF1559 [Rhodopirellula maiorica SM1]|uniref:Protein containing DUF1559 n=1 Tax=Rhodopirellula maiorica SM1 TaxID=1265738 RepID=M5RB95_9BACT|nr:DUF1559 domain-containing protein [Rhodopirellula maiorica]EMI16311.1 protein containing DUF1559 [Rhodopirellula maiorica SM1]
MTLSSGASRNVATASGGNPRRSEPRRVGFTTVELFGVLIIITVLIWMLLPAVQAAREQARRTSCANNLMQVGLGVQAYHEAFGQFPVQLSGTDANPAAGKDNDRRLSIFVGLLPFLGHDAAWNEIQTTREMEDGFLYDMGMGMGQADWGDDELTEQETDLDEGEGTLPEPWVAGGPEPFVDSYEPWRWEFSVYRCPSDPGMGAPAYGRTNYAVCFGDGMVAADTGPYQLVDGVFVYSDTLAEQTEAAMRGVFVPRVVTRISDITDGLSNTIMLGEIATDLGDQDIRTSPIAGPGSELRDHPNWARDLAKLIDPERPRFWKVEEVATDLRLAQEKGRGFRWGDGMPLYSGFNTILPPNREITLAQDNDDSWGVLTASSRHQGGAHVCFADGSVRFIGDSIEAGDESRSSVYLGSPNPPGSKSPYGLWGSLGTRSSGELTQLPSP